jgi:predicted nucleic acid-binding protein
LTPAFVYDEIENYEELIVEKSGMEPGRVAQFIDLLFQCIEVVPADEFYPAIDRADEAIGNTDPDDVLYLACAVANDAAIWSDASDFDEQDVVETYSTNDVIYSFDTLSQRTRDFRPSDKAGCTQIPADITISSVRRMKSISDRSIDNPAESAGFTLENMGAAGL